MFAFPVKKWTQSIQYVYSHFLFQRVFDAPVTERI